MQNEKRHRGRPRFRIVPERLLRMREDAHLTQVELAKRVYKGLGDSKTELAVMKTNYQRWERTGAMTPEVAKHLAAELGTTVAVLQGATPEAPPSTLAQIVARLRELSMASAPRVLSALEKCADYAEPVQELAQRIAYRLEAAQLSQDQAELTKLSALTGWTVEHLQRPVGWHGHWLLIRSGGLGPHRSEILAGTSALLYEIRTDLRESLSQIPESDARVSFYEDAPWFRIEVQHPCISRLTRTLRFVRAQPTEAGLHWTRPTLWDLDMIHELPADAFRLANFVDGFSADRLTTQDQDLARLRLALVRIPTVKEYRENGLETRPEMIGLAKLGPDEPPPNVLDDFRIDGYVHDLVTNWLASAMWDLLEPLLHAWPIEYWRLGEAGQHLDVCLDAPVPLILQRGAEPRSGPLYQIHLMAESPDGQLRKAPWRDASVAAVRQRLQRFLDRHREEVCVGPPRPLFL